MIARVMAKRNLARVDEIEAELRSYPEFDQALAALRDLGESILSFSTAPYWRPRRLANSYRAMVQASKRLEAEMARLSRWQEQR